MNEENTQQTEQYFSNPEPEKVEIANWKFILSILAFVLILSGITLLVLINFFSAEEVFEKPVIPVSYTAVEVQSHEFIEQNFLHFARLALESEKRANISFLAIDGKVLHSVSSFFSRIKEPVPNELRKSALGISIGYFSEQRTSFPFVLIKGVDQASLQKGMLSFENTLPLSLSDFGITSSVNTGFRTQHILNSYARINGVLYGYLDNKTVVIVRDEADFRAILNFYRDRI